MGKSVYVHRRISTAHKIGSSLCLDDSCTPRFTTCSTRAIDDPYLCVAKLIRICALPPRRKGVDVMLMCPNPMAMYSICILMGRRSKKIVIQIRRDTKNRSVYYARRVVGVARYVGEGGDSLLGNPLASPRSVLTGIPRVSHHLQPVSNILRRRTNARFFPMGQFHAPQRRGRSQPWIEGRARWAIGIGEGVLSYLARH